MFHHGSGTNAGAAKNNISATTLRRSAKKPNWGNRKRAGMSFLIVIAFFAVFGIIILTELLMIDNRTHSGMMTIQQHYGNRFSDSMPDYDNVKEDYDPAAVGVSTGSGQIAANIIDNAAAVTSAANGLPLIAWGKVLPIQIEETLPPYPFALLPTDGVWQIVNGTRFKFFVFSAFYDRRDGSKLVRVVGATKTRGPERVWCRFWYKARPHATKNKRLRYSSVTVMARVKMIRENWNLKYSACFVLCPVHELAPPQHVSIVARLRTPPGNLLLLRNTDEDVDFTAKANVTANHALSNITSELNAALPVGDEIADKIAICVKPFHFSYDQSLYLMEFIEFYTLLGVSHFTFYNHTIGPHAQCVLQHYAAGDVPANLTAMDEDLIPHSRDDSVRTEYVKREHRTNYAKPTITILPWNLRMQSQKEIRTEGLFAALNDCLYRTMYRYKYLALIDLDEFIVPRHNDTLKDLINSLNRRFRNRNVGAYSFQNAFFYLQFPDDALAYKNTANGEHNARLRASLVTQRKTKRRFELHPQKQRSKYICKPEAVIEAGNHFVWEFVPGKGSLNALPSEAILQHYRVCEFGGNDCIKAPSIVDRTATKYVNRLIERVRAVYNYLKKSCDLHNLPKLPNEYATASSYNNKPAMSMQIVNSSNSINLKTTVTQRNNNNKENSTKQSLKMDNVWTRYLTLLNRVTPTKNEEFMHTTSNNNNNNNVETHTGMLAMAKTTMELSDMQIATNTQTADDIAFNKKQLTTAEMAATTTNRAIGSRVRKKRRVVVFETNERGEQFGIIKYVD